MSTATANYNFAASLTRSIFKNCTFDSTFKMYFIENQSYSFLNLKAFYQPESKPWTLSLMLNNLFDENRFATQQVSTLGTVKTSVNLVPRYALVAATYRF